MKLTDFTGQESVTIIAKSEFNEIRFQAIITKILRENVAIIEIQSEENYKFNFDNVQIDMEYNPGDNIPIIWRNVRIVYLKNQYVLQVNKEGVRFNRRNCFRLPMGKTVQMNILGKQPCEVTLKDISLSGFSVVDRNKDTELFIGNDVCIIFEDLGYELKLVGRLVRIHEGENKKTYGFELRNLCKDLSPYITIMQQRNRIRAKQKGE